MSSLCLPRKTMMPYAIATITGAQKHRDSTRKFRANRTLEQIESDKVARSQYREQNREEIQRKDRIAARKRRARAKKVQ